MGHIDLQAYDNEQALKLYFDTDFEKFYNLDLNWWNNKKIDWKKIGYMRDNISKQNYWQTLCEFISMLEGCKLFPYLDNKNYAIGYGLSIKKIYKNEYEPLAIKLFQEALGIDLYAFLPIEIFEQEESSLMLNLQNYSLTQAQCDALLSHTLAYHDIAIENKIKNFNKLLPNQKIAIHSLWYNLPTLIGPNLIQFLLDYNATNDIKYILDCLNEIEQNSNVEGAQHYLGVQNRRYKEGLMFSDRKLDFIIKVPEKYFHDLFAQLSLDFPLLYQELSKKFLNLDNDMFMSVKLAILSGFLDHIEFPAIEYLQQKLKIIENLYR